jgi:hypothetical protein
MTITTESGYIAARAGIYTSAVQKATIASMTAGTIADTYRSTGPNPGQPAIPGAAAVCTSATAGAQPLPTVAGGNALYLDEMVINSTIACMVHAVDRIIHSGGLNGTLTTLQSVATPTLPARAVALECEWFLTCYTALGATTTTATVNVDYSDGTLSQTIAVTVPASWAAGRLLPIVPALGKRIAKINSVTLAATTGTAGNFGVVCFERLGAACTMVAANIGDKSTSLILPVAADACISHIVDLSTTSTGDIRGHMKFIQG